MQPLQCVQAAQQHQLSWQPLGHVAGNYLEIATRLFSSAELAAALGEPSMFGDDNIANATNDIRGAQALASTVRQAGLAQKLVDTAFAKAMAIGLYEGASEATALLIAAAAFHDNTTAVSTASQAIQQVSVSNPCLICTCAF